MNAELIGMISGIMVILSVIPYSIRVYQGKVSPNLTGWSLWTLIGFLLLVTYKSSGAGANIWPAVFGFTNPLLITILVVKRHGGWVKPNIIEVGCLIFGLISLGLWLIVRESKELSQYALYLAIIADMFAAIPTIIFVWKNPQEDRPFAWMFFAVGYGLVLFAIKEHTIANYILPLYMFFGSLAITSPLILYRLRAKVPFSEWM